MIERYFNIGVRLNWNCPTPDTSQPKDGSIFDNPALSAPHPIIYDGMDGELFNFGAPHANTMGLTMRMNIPHTWLVYAHGRTTKLAIPANDVLTGPMSGCLIATWSSGGIRYVGHVGTIESSVAISTTVKTAFAAAMAPDTKGFLPANEWDPDTEIKPKQQKFKTLIPDPKIIALVTSAGDFYSILGFALKDKMGQVSAWCIGGIKKVAPMDYAAVRTKMTT